MFPGLDVSNYQGQVDWPTAAKLGRTFAMIEAMDGATFNDATFDPQWDGAGAAGLVKFAYLFWRAEESDDDQMTAWIAKLKPRLRIADGVMLDCENESGATGDVTNRVVFILDRLTVQLGVRPLFYSSSAWIGAHLHADARLAQSGLVQADWGKVRPPTPKPWGFSAFWQDGATSDVPTTGQAGDRDWFLGPIARLALYGKLS